MPGCIGTGAAKRSYPMSEDGAAAKRSYPMSEVRAVPKMSYPMSEVRVVAERSYPMPKVRAAAQTSYHTPKVRGGGQKEKAHVQGVAAAGARRAERSYSHSRSGGVAVRRYPSSKVRSSSWLCWSRREEIPHIQGKRNPSKTGGVVRGHQRADTLKS